MSIIYSLPLTNILVNGTKTYRIRTRDYDQILQHVEVSSKTNETINLDFTDLYFQDIAFASNSDLGEVTLKCIRETKDVKNFGIVDSRPITCSDELKDEYLPELQFLVMRGYLIDIPVPQPIHIQSINIFGPESIKTEGSVEYFASIFPVDANEYNLGWYIDDAPTGVVARIRWNATDPVHATLEIESIDAGVDSDITIVCYDDVSGVEQSYSIRIYKEVVPVYIQNIAISGPSQITEPGVYNYYATISPSDADEYDIDWDTVGFTDPHWYLQTDPDDPFHAQIVIPETESFGSAFYLRCEDNVSFNYDRFSISIDIYIEPPVPADGPLCFTARSSDVVMTIPLAALTNPMISTDGVNWSAAPATYIIPANESVYVKADRCISSTATNRYFIFSGTVDASGNIMSLTGDINNLNMTGNSFNFLFQNCRTLTTAPKLPATTLSSQCYRSMFYRCTSLTQAPELPATTLADYCYQSMLYGCSSLSYIKVGATTWGAYDSTDWVSGVSSTGTFYKKAGVNIPVNVNGIPSGWTVVEY